MSEEVINRTKASVLCICESENPDSIIGTAFVWDFMDSEVFILTNYHTWSDEFSYCFPPPPLSTSVSPKNKKKRKKIVSEDVQHAAQLILRNDFEFRYPFTLTSDLFYRWSLDDDFAVLKLPRNQFQFLGMRRIPVQLSPSSQMCIHAFGYIRHTKECTVTDGEITGHIPLCYTMNLLSGPKYSGALITDPFGQAVGYMGVSLDASKRLNSQRQSFAFKFNTVLRATNRNSHRYISPITSQS